MKLTRLLDLKKNDLFCDRLRSAPIFLLVVPLLVASLASAQSLSGLLGNKTQASSATRGTADSLNRTTPRSAILYFLEACHGQRYVTAARYLDLRKIPAEQRRTEGPELAKQLADILGRDGETLRDRLLRPLVVHRKLEQLHPKKRNTPHQAYRTTENGAGVHKEAR